MVYHFTEKKFNVFELRGLSNGFFFTENKKDEEFSYTKKVNPYFLNIKKMSELSEIPYEQWSVPYYENEWIKKSKDGGSNGIQFIRENIDFHNKISKNKRIIVAFEPEQIKLADGTNTTFDANNPDIRFETGGNVLLAPNGKPSNLTLEQYKLVRTPAFKKWFGDWENDPKNASKVVDENGEPQVVYHSSKNEFNTFKKEKISENFDYSFGFHFSNNLEDSKNYGKITKSFFLNIKNPFVFNVEDKTNGSVYIDANRYHAIHEIVNSRKTNKEFDGVIAYSFTNGYVAMYANQIKLADGTNTTFDPNNENIRFETGGTVLLASNGKPSNLTPEQYKAVRTPEFKAWFGDWENDPKNASKVVDENGEPLVVYHGSELRFTEFKNRNPNIKGYFFSNEINTSRTYGEKTYEVFLNIKSPFSLDAKGGNFQTDLDIEVAVKYPNEEEYKTTVKENSDNIVRLAMGIDKNSFWKLDGSFDGCIFYNFKDQSLSSQRNEIQNTYVAFKPNQIKLADGTNLTFDPNNDDIRFQTGGTVLLAPNGKPSNLPLEQYKLVRTPAFKKWFGDWENDPETASKVVDSNGEPRVVYHGTKKGGFSVFDENKIGENTHNADIGFFFIDTYQGAKSYSGANNKNSIQAEPISTNYTVFLNLKNPKYIFWGNGKYQNSWNAKVGDYNGIKEFIKSASEENYDGAIIEGVNDSGEEDCYYDCGNMDYIAFNSNQIKLADGTNLTFDPNNDDIRFQTGGTVLLAPNGQPSNLTTEQYKLVRTPAFKKWFGDWENDRENASNVVDENGEPLVVYHGTKNNFNKFSLEYTATNSGNLGFLGRGFYFATNQKDAKNYGEIVKSYFLKALKALDLRNMEYKELAFLLPNLKMKNGKAWKDAFIEIDNIKSQIKAIEIEDLKNGFFNVHYEYNGNWGMIPRRTIHQIESDKGLNVIVDRLIEEDPNNIGAIGNYFNPLTLSQEIKKEGFDSIMSDGTNIFDLGDEIVVFEPNQIKLADGTNTTFDPNNEDIRFENGGLTEIEQWKLEQAQNDQQAFNLLQNYFGFELPENADTYEYKKGGNLDKDIECHNCGWEWDKKDSEKFDMYVCHKCGFDNSGFYKRGGRTVAQTPAPSSERIYGSKRNKPSSSKDSSSAESIKFDQKTLTSIENKVEKHNAEHRDKRISLSIAKAIVRRGMGAYSKSHRPTIKGGKPNSRVAWGLARLNAFIYKVVHGVSKSGKYSQDNDLLDELGIAHEKFKTGGKISKKNKHGDCYVVAGRIALNNRLPKGENREFVGEPYVIHAQVIGQGAIEGLKYGHAWVEDDIYVYDYSNGRELKIPKVVYYKLGQVIEQQPIYFKYTFGEAKRKMAETGHFGSWDLITESGL